MRVHYFHLFIGMWQNQGTLNATDGRNKDISS